MYTKIYHIYQKMSTPPYDKTNKKTKNPETMWGGVSGFIASVGGGHYGRKEYDELLEEGSSESVRLNPDLRVHHHETIRETTKH